MATMGMDIGGAETHIAELSKQLKAQGHDVIVVSNGGVYVPEIAAAGIRHYQAPLNRRDVGQMRRARAILKDVLKKERPDIVHAHARIPAFLCGGLCRRMGIPFVTTAHWVFDTRGLLRYLTDWGQRTMAVSEDIKAYLIREYHLPPEHIFVTINGIDTDKFSPAVSGERVLREFGLDPVRPVVSYVSRMDADRALAARQLIEIAPRLDKAVPGVQLLIAGGGNVFDELKDRAEAVNEKMGRRCIAMTGPRTDINEIAAAGQVFVGVSRAALEAMSAGKPVIVAGNEGYHGLFTPDKLAEAQAGNFCCRGLPLCEPETLLADLSAALLLPEEEKERLGAYGRQVIFDHYSVRRMAGDCLRMYREVVRRRYNVVMSGYYGFSNAGDDAILQSIHEGIMAASDEIGVTVLSRDPELTRRQYGLAAVPRFSFFQVKRVLKRCDALLSGGGSLLQDRTSTRSLVYYLSVIRWAKRMGKPVMLYANGIGPVTRPENREKVKQTVELADVVTLRDQASARELLDMGVTRPELHRGAGSGAAAGDGAARGGRLCGGVRAGLARRGGLPGADRPAVRPPAPRPRAGDPVPDDAARRGSGDHGAGAPGHGGPLLSAGRVCQPQRADGCAGPGQAVRGHAPAHPDLCRPHGSAHGGAGVRPQGGQLSAGAGAALRRGCGAL